MVAVDLDDNGWADFVATRNQGPMVAFRNLGVAGRQALSVRLRGPPGNPSGIGARITLESGGGVTQTIQAGSGYYSQTAPVAFFGWTPKKPPSALRVRWPDGRVTAHPVSKEASTVVLEQDGGRR